MAGELVHASVGTGMTQAEYEATAAHTMTWADWTPTVTQSVSVTVTVTEAKYAIIGKVCHIYAKLAVTGAGTAGNGIQVDGVPAAAQSAVTGTRFVVGVFAIADSGTTDYAGSVLATAAGQFKFLSDGNGDYQGVAPSWALANNDTINFSATYRIA